MPCLVGCFAIGFPRIALLLVWLLAPGYLGRAFQTVLWPILGFLFMPLTTLAYAFAINANGKLDGIYLVLFILAVIIDLGLFGSGESSRRRWRRRARG